MGEFHKIHPIPICRLTVEKGGFLFLHMKEYGKKVSIPVYVWLIEGGGESILVDTACTAEDFSKYTLYAEELEDISPIEEALPKAGVSLSDIKTIIITHLDADHILNIRKFPNARLIVQEEEMSFARNPHPFFANKYHQHLYEGLDWETVRGDKEIIPGVEVMFTPGHTAGGQSIAVTTERGKVVIPGLCSIDENYDTEVVSIPGMHFDPIKAYDSVVRIRKMADVVLPTHSQSLLGTESFP